MFYSFSEEGDFELKVGFVHLSSCSGCQVSFLDMFEDAVEILDTVKLVYSNMLTRQRKIPEMDVAFVEGAVCLEDYYHLNLLKQLKEKVKAIVTIGACSSFGGIRRLSCGNQIPQPQEQSFVPVTEVEILRNKVKYAIPGCPPNPSLLYAFLLALLESNEDFLTPFEYMASSSKVSGLDIIAEVVNKGFCIGCGTCSTACPTRAITYDDLCSKPLLNFSRCVSCGSCLAACPQTFKTYPQPTY